MITLLQTYPNYESLVNYPVISYIVAVTAFFFISIIIYATKKFFNRFDTIEQKLDMAINDNIRIDEKHKSLKDKCESRCIIVDKRLNDHAHRLDEHEKKISVLEHKTNKL